MKNKKYHTVGTVNVLESTALYKITSSIMTKKGCFTKYVTQ